MVILPEKQMYGVIANVQAKLESQKANLLSFLVLLTGAFFILLPLIVVFLTSFGGEATTTGDSQNN
jgi:multiple sugar transport system permease protein